MLRQHVHVQTLRFCRRTLQVQVVHSLALLGRHDGAKGSSQQRVGLRELGQALNFAQQLGAHRLDVVMIPADSVYLIGQHRVGLDDRRGLLAVRQTAVDQDVAGLQLRVRLLLRPPQFDRRRRFQRRLAVGRHMDHGQVGIDPNPHDGVAIALAGLDRGGGVTQAERLAKRLAGGKGIRFQMHADFADLDQPGVVVPGVGLADEELQVAIGFDPQIQADVAVAQGQRTAVVRTGRLPDHVQGVQRIRRRLGGRNGPARPDGNQQHQRIPNSAGVGRVPPCF